MRKLELDILEFALERNEPPNGYYRVADYPKSFSRSFRKDPGSFVPVPGEEFTVKEWAPFAHRGERDMSYVGDRFVCTRVIVNYDYEVIVCGEKLASASYGGKGSYAFYLDHIKLAPYRPTTEEIRNLRSEVERSAERRLLLAKEVTSLREENRRLREEHREFKRELEGLRTTLNRSLTSVNVSLGRSLCS